MMGSDQKTISTAESATILKHAKDCNIVNDKTEQLFKLNVQFLVMWFVW
jgi:hypothetical protein